MFAVAIKTAKFTTLNKCFQRCVATNFNAATLLSEQNRLRCIQSMQQLAPLNLKIKTKNKENEKSLAAVLIALCTDDKGEVSLLYTKRSANLSRHVRQVSFPGGMKDDTDKDYIECALRETEEEIGLPRSRVEIVGIGSLFRAPQMAAIMPVVGVVENFSLGELRLNENEVEEAFTLPIAKLSDPQSLNYTQFKSGYSAPVFVVDNYRIWGVTGYLTMTFLNCFLPKELNQLKDRVQFVKPYKVPMENR